MARLAERIKLWRESLPEDQQPLIAAILSNGAAIDVHQVAAEGHNGIMVEGTLDGQPCMVVAHQSNLQLLCYIAKVQDEKDRRVIGFASD